jgi:hypothetical protein
MRSSRSSPSGARAAFAAVIVAVAGVTLGVVAPPATASALIDRNARNVTLKVDGEGRAVVSYRDERGRTRRVLAWGAINDDTKFKLDYAGGWGAFRKPVWKTITACGHYDGPKLAWVVAACKAPDGSYWALQSWQRLLPNQGYTPFKPIQAAWELHLSHWRGPLPVLEVYLDWVYGGKFEHLFGRYTYGGKAVHGHASTSTGIPLDPYGRNIYLDVFGSAYGPGWKRENSFLAHRPNGSFCYGFFPRASHYDRSRRPAGNGRRYRATAIGPGVAPDAFWESAALGEYDADYERRMNALNDVVTAGDSLCRQR